MKKEQAFRLMQALSGVDEELLERSEEENRKHWTGIYYFMGKYGKTCAAVFCIVTLGAALWARETIGLHSDDKMAGGAVEHVAEQLTEGVAEEAAIAETGIEDAAKEETPQEAYQTGMMADKDTGTWKEPQWTAEKKEMLVSEEAEKSNGAAEHAGMISLEEAYAIQNLGKYIPTELPEGYAFQYASDNGMKGMQNGVTLLWCNGESELWLHITQTDMSVEMRFDAAPPIFTVEEEWESLLPEKDEDGGQQFGILHEDGVLVEYCGCLSEEELDQIFSFSSMR